MLELLQQRQTLNDLELTQRFPLVFGSMIQEFSGSIVVDSDFLTRQLQWFQWLRSKDLGLYRQDDDNLLDNDVQPTLFSIVSRFNLGTSRHDTTREMLDHQLSWLLNLLISGADPHVCGDRGENALYVVVATVFTRFGSENTNLIDHEMVHWAL